LQIIFLASNVIQVRLYDEGVINNIDKERLMALFTPYGLKIRFDEAVLEKVIRPLKKYTDFNDLLMDVDN